MNKFANVVISTYITFIHIPIFETHFGIICIRTNLWWNIVTDDWNLDQSSLSKWQVIATLEICNLRKHLQGMTDYVRLTLVLMTLHQGLQLVSSKKIKIGHSKCNI